MPWARFHERKNLNVKLCGTCLCRRQAWKWQCFEEVNIVPIPLSIADRWTSNFPFNCENRTNWKHFASCTICWIVSMHHKHDSFHPYTIAVNQTVHKVQSISQSGQWGRATRVAPPTSNFIGLIMDQILLTRTLEAWAYAFLCVWFCEWFGHITEILSANSRLCLVTMVILVRIHWLMFYCT